MCYICFFSYDQLKRFTGSVNCKLYSCLLYFLHDTDNMNVQGEYAQCMIGKNLTYILFVVGAIFITTVE